jgi:hypothetical protein
VCKAAWLQRQVGNCNSLTKVLQWVDPLDNGSSQTILSMDIWDRVLNFNPQGHPSNWSHMRRIQHLCPCELIKFDFQDNGPVA